MSCHRRRRVSDEATLRTACHWSIHPPRRLLPYKEATCGSSAESDTADLSRGLRLLTAKLRLDDQHRSRPACTVQAHGDCLPFVMPMPWLDRGRTNPIPELSPHARFSFGLRSLGGHSKQVGIYSSLANLPFYCPSATRTRLRSQPFTGLALERYQLSTLVKVHVVLICKPADAGFVLGLQRRGG